MEIGAPLLILLHRHKKRQSCSSRGLTGRGNVGDGNSARHTRARAAHFCGPGRKGTLLS